MTIRNNYTLSGAILLAVGLLVSAVAYLVFEITWLTALGLATIILAVIILALSRSISPVSPELGSLFLETGQDNLSRIVEELGIKERAIYLPPAITGGKAQALLPLNSHPPGGGRIPPLPARLIVRYGPAPEDMGLLITTPGTVALRLLEAAPSPTTGGLESALTALLAGTLGIADGARVNLTGNQLSLEIINHRLPGNTLQIQPSLGSLLAAIAATLAAAAWNRPAAILKEENRGKEYSIQLELLE